MTSAVEHWLDLERRQGADDRREIAKLARRCRSVLHSPGRTLARALYGGIQECSLPMRAVSGHAPRRIARGEVIAIAACLAPTNNPLHESRLYAAMHLAVHDALNAIDRRSRPYAFDARRRLPGASVDAVVAAAARDVLVPLLQQLPGPFSDCAPAAVASVETDYAAALAAITDGPGKDQGVQLGRAAAATILAVRTGNGAATPLFDTAYAQGTAPGEYRFTPGFSFAFAPGWADVTPFVLRDSSQFRADPRYEVTSARHAADFAEVKRLGGDGVTTPNARTADQTEIARFWVEGPIPRECCHPPPSMIRSMVRIAAGRPRSATVPHSMNQSTGVK